MVDDPDLVRVRRAAEIFGAPRQLGILFVLLRSPWGLTSTDLIAELGLSKQMVHVTLARLLDRKLIVVNYDNGGAGGRPIRRFFADQDAVTANLDTLRRLVP